MSRAKEIFVVGPTASGKTSYAIKLAKATDGVIINVDSRQVYKHMDIGTNKGILRVQKSEFRIQNGEFSIQGFELEESGVIGYMFNIVNPDEEFNLAIYLKLVAGIRDYFKNRNKVLIFTGGTGLYVDAMIKKYELIDIYNGLELRERLEKLSKSQLYDELYQLDTEAVMLLNESDRENRRRLIRKIEKVYAGKNPGKSSDVKEYKMYYPKFERKALYERIDLRVDEMFDEGLVEEVEKLIEMGYKHTKPMQGMGYKEVVAYLDGEYTLDETKSKIKQAHRNYAARQITWFGGEGRGYELTMIDF